MYNVVSLSQLLSEGQRTFGVTSASLRSFLQRNFAAVEKAAKGKKYKELHQLYQQHEKTEGMSLHFCCCIAHSSTCFLLHIGYHI